MTNQRTLFDAADRPYDEELLYCAGCHQTVSSLDCDSMGGDDCVFCVNCGAAIVMCELGLIAPAGKRQWESVGGTR